MKKETTAEFLARYAEELQSFETRPLTCEMSAVHLMVLIGALQLALRHPQFPEASAQITRDFIDGWALAFQYQKKPAIKEMIERGYNPNFDEKL